MSGRDIFRQAADALQRAIDAHGAPNRFSLGELHREYGGPRPLDVGRLVRNGRADYVMRYITVYLGRSVEYAPGSPSFIRVADENGSFVAGGQP